MTPKSEVGPITPCPGATPLDLDPIKAREAEATEGPWIVAGHAREDGERWVVFRGGKGEDSSILHDQDAQFIAHARQDIPALIAEVEALRQRLLAAPSAALVDREALQQLVATWTKRAAGYAFYGQPFHPRADAIRECVKELTDFLSPRTDTPTGEPKRDGFGCVRG